MCGVVILVNILISHKVHRVFRTVLTSDMVSVETSGMRRNASWSHVLQQLDTPQDPTQVRKPIHQADLFWLSRPKLILSFIKVQYQRCDDLLLLIVQDCRPCCHDV